MNNLHRSLKSERMNSLLLTGGLTAGLCLALTLPGMARNELDGTGAVESNGTLFTNATNGQGFYVDASVETDWWVMGKDPQDIAASGDTGKDVMTHIDETLGAGDSFWMGFTFEYPQSPYGKGTKDDWTDAQDGIKMGFYSETERTGSRDLEGAEIWLGINYWNEAEEGLISEVNTALGISSPSGISGDPANYTQGFNVEAQESLSNDGIQAGAPGAADGFNASEIPNDIDLWNKFTVGASNGNDWGLVLDTEEDSFILSWVVGIVLPGVPFTDTVASDDITTVIDSGDPSDDILFRWTVDEKGMPITDTAFVNDPDIHKNPDFGTNPFEIEEMEIIPEPSSAGLLMLGALALVMRRKRG